MSGRAGGGRGRVPVQRARAIQDRSKSFPLLPLASVENFVLLLRVLLPLLLALHYVTEAW